MMQLVIARAAALRPDLAATDQNRSLLYNALTEMGYDCVKPQGAFYMMGQIPQWGFESFL